MASSLYVVLSIGSPLFADTRGIKVRVKLPEGETVDLYRESYALVIGNGNYRKGWDPLPGAIRDSKEVAHALKKHGFKVTHKTDLTKNGFERVFGNFVFQYGKDKENRLLFYYAGHGHTQSMATNEQLGYLVMVDAPAPTRDPVGFSLSSLDMQYLVTQAKMIQAKHVLFMFDSCFSGTVLNLRDRVVPRSVSDNIRYPVRQFITAGRANEPVPDYSVFKQAFLDLLEGRDKEPIPDGYITGEELALYLKNKVPTYNRAQHPQYGKIRDPKLDKGDFIFVIPEIPEEVKKWITLEFRLVDESKRSDSLPMKEKGEDRTLWLSPRVELDQRDVVSSKIAIGPFGQPYVEIFFTAAGAKKFSYITARNIGRQLAIVVNGEVVSAPVIQDEITDGKAQITGMSTIEETEDLVTRINESIRK